MKKQTKGKVYNMMLLSFLGILFMASSVLSLYDVVTIFSGNKTQGQVVDATYYGNGQNGKWIIKINYVDSDGNAYILQKIGKFQPFYNKNDIVTIYYNKKNPNNATDFSTFSAISPLISLILLFCVIFVMVKYSKEK